MENRLMGGYFAAYAAVFLFRVVIIVGVLLVAAFAAGYYF